jgi:hypothetical protein
MVETEFVLGWEGREHRCHLETGMAGRHASRRAPNPVTLCHQAGAANAPVSYQDHAQPVLALLLGRQRLGLLREEDAPRQTDLVYEFREACAPGAACRGGFRGGLGARVRYEVHHRLDIPLRLAASIAAALHLPQLLAMLRRKPSRPHLHSSGTRVMKTRLFVATAGASPVSDPKVLFSTAMSTGRGNSRSAHRYALPGKQKARY